MPNGWRDWVWNAEIEEVGYTTWSLTCSYSRKKSLSPPNSKKAGLPCVTIFFRGDVMLNFRSFF